MDFVYIIWPYQFQSTFLREERPFSSSFPVMFKIDFNPRSYERNDIPTCKVYDFAGNISIHVPTRGTTNFCIDTPKASNISIHVPTRGTTFNSSHFTGSYGNFNPRSYERNDIWTTGIDEDGNNFNPRSYERNDIMYQNLINASKISIHVPTRGTTYYQAQFSQEDHISIHVPTRGTTEKLYQDNLKLTISIHVPTRGTTLMQEVQLMKHGRFQSTFLREERRQGNIHKGYAAEFQSTFLREERRCKLGRQIHYYNFNPRSYERNDLKLTELPGDIPISIHVPTRGTTFKFLSSHV